jgi:hypothetical protein
MTDQAISPLRRRMIEDMSIRKFTPGTQHTYVRFVKEFSIFFRRSPDKAAFEVGSRSAGECTRRPSRSCPRPGRCCLARSCQCL